MNGLTFNAVDVETANVDRSSICQIGIVHVVDGEIRDQWQSLINPEDWFDPWNIGIHGIDEAAVQGCPTLPEAHEELCQRLQGSVLVSHTAYDRTAFKRAMDKHGLDQLQVAWLDSARIARRAWPDRYGARGWGLANISKDLGISFRHHDAQEDARAAAHIVLRACRDTGLDIEAWLQRLQQSIRPSHPSLGVKREGNPDGELYGHAVVFTGRLAIPRAQAADLAAHVGCTVAQDVTKKTTMLVVGVQIRNRLNGYEKSRRHRDAESLIRQGQEICLLSEADFSEVVGLE